MSIAASLDPSALTPKSPRSFFPLIPSRPAILPVSFSLSWRYRVTIFCSSGVSSVLEAACPFSFTSGTNALPPAVWGRPFVAVSFSACCFAAACAGFAAAVCVAKRFSLGVVGFILPSRTFLNLSKASCLSWNSFPSSVKFSPDPLAKSPPVSIVPWSAVWYFCWALRYSFFALSTSVLSPSSLRSSASSVILFAKLLEALALDSLLACFLISESRDWRGFNSFSNILKTLSFSSIFPKTPSSALILPTARCWSGSNSADRLAASILLFKFSSPWIAPLKRRSFSSGSKPCLAPFCLSFCCLVSKLKLADPASVPSPIISLGIARPLAISLVMRLLKSSCKLCCPNKSFSNLSKSFKVNLFLASDLSRSVSLWGSRAAAPSVFPLTISPALGTRAPRPEVNPVAEPTNGLCSLPLAVFEGSIPNAEAAAKLSGRIPRLSLLSSEAFSSLSASPASLIPRFWFSSCFEVLLFGAPSTTGSMPKKDLPSPVLAAFRRAASLVCAWTPCRLLLSALPTTTSACPTSPTRSRSEALIPVEPTSLLSRSNFDSP